MFKIGAPIFTWKFIGQVTLAKNLVFVPLGNSNKVKWYLVAYLNGCLLRSGCLFISTISNSRPLNNIPQMHRGGKTFYRGAIIGRMTGEVTPFVKFKTVYGKKKINTFKIHHQNR